MQQLNYIYHTLSILFIIALGFVTTYSLENYMDILLWDEARYLDRGLWLWHAYPKNSSPLYSVWYKILSLFTENRIALYYLNFKVLTLLSTILMYIFLIVYKTPKFIALFFSIMWLYSAYNLPVWPKVSHFALLIILLAAIFISKLKSLFNQLVVFTSSLLLASFVRPELYVAFVLFLGVSILFIIRNRTAFSKSNYVSVFSFFLLFVVIYFLYKTPFTSGDTSRGSFAFVQHFAHNYAIWTKESIVFWYEWIAVLKKCFPEPYTFKNIVWNVDSYLWKHLFFNFFQLTKHILLIILSIFSPINFLQTKPMFFLFSIIFLVYILVNYKISFSVFKTHCLKNKTLLLFLSISIIPVLMSSIYAHPRMHYMVMSYPILLLLISFLFIKKENKKISKVTPSIALLFFLIIGAKAKNFKYFDMFGTNDGLMNKKTIQYLENKYKTDSIKILDIEGGLNTMMTQNFVSINPNIIFQDSSIQFSTIIQTHQPDVIYITPILKKLKVIQSDSVFQKMLLNPSEYNFIAQKTSTFDAYLLVKKNLK